MISTILWHNSIEFCWKRFLGIVIFSTYLIVDSFHWHLENSRRQFWWWSFTSSMIFWEMFDDEWFLRSHRNSFMVFSWEEIIYRMSFFKIFHIEQFLRGQRNSSKEIWWQIFVFHTLLLHLDFHLLEERVFPHHWTDLWLEGISSRIIQWSSPAIAHLLPIWWEYMYEILV